MLLLYSVGVILLANRRIVIHRRHTILYLLLGLYGLHLNLSHVITSPNIYVACRDILHHIFIRHTDRMLLLNLLLLILLLISWSLVVETHGRWSGW